jgi:D-3-phosphoglycerate dehydrogenase
MSNTTRRVAILETIFGEADIERAALAPRGYDVSYHHVFDEDEVIAAGRGACGILLETAHITPRVMDALPECKVYSRYGVGVDTIEVDAATERGIAVMNVPDYCMDEVAEHAIALAFALTRGVAAHDRGIRQGKWLIERHGVRTLVGRTFGIVGFGRIGKAVAWRAAALGMNVMAYDLQPVPLPGVRVKFAASLEELLPQVDVLSLHVPLNAHTRDLIGAPQLALMKHDAILVNTARGAVVNQAALVDALTRGLISGAAADVHTTEPIPSDSPLLSAPNLVLTPHMAFYSPEAQLKMRRMVAENIADFFDGKGEDHIVNGIRCNAG